jgi:hypothetical protein
MIVDTITNDLFFRIFPFFSHHGPVSTFLFCAVFVTENPVGNKLTFLFSHGDSPFLPILVL